jgi:hypothetical protein
MPVVVTGQPHASKRVTIGVDHAPNDVAGRSGTTGAGL